MKISIIVIAYTNAHSQIARQSSSCCLLYT